jgi:hypothetical protein
MTTHPQPVQEVLAFWDKDNSQANLAVTHYDGFVQYYTMRLPQETWSVGRGTLPWIKVEWQIQPTYLPNLGKRDDYAIAWRFASTGQLRFFGYSQQVLRRWPTLIVNQIKGADN